MILNVFLLFFFRFLFFSMEVSVGILVLKTATSKIECLVMLSEKDSIQNKVNGFWMKKQKLVDNGEK